MDAEVRMVLLGWLVWFVWQLVQITLLALAVWLFCWPFTRAARYHRNPLVRAFAFVYCGIVVAAAIGALGLLAVL